MFQAFDAAWAESLTALEGTLSEERVPWKTWLPVLIAKRALNSQMTSRIRKSCWPRHAALVQRLRY